MHPCAVASTVEPTLDAIGAEVGAMSVVVESKRTRGQPHRENANYVLPEACAVQINSRLMELEARLDDVPETAENASAHKAVRHWVAQARTATSRRSRLRRDAMKDWWSGKWIEQGWTAVNQAEAALIMLEPPRKVFEGLPALQEELDRAVDKQDPRYIAYTARLRDIAEDKRLSSGEREGLVQIRRIIDRASDDTHRGQRSFRNIVMLTCGFLTFMLFIAVVWHAINPAFLSLCRDNQGATTCLDGTANAKPIDLAEVVGVGLLAGLLSGLFTVGKLKTVRSAYDIPRVQVILKAVAGATTAVLGILILQSGVVLLPASTSAAAMLSYAALFGYSQELFTRVVDRYASSLLAASP
jgi:hypothetical protein